MDTYKTTGRIATGTLDVDRKRLKAALTAMRDGPVVITIQRQKPKRSVQANAFYWAVVVAMIAEETGQDPESVHEFLKREVNAQHVAMTNKSTGEVFDAWIGASTASLNVNDFYDYVEGCRAWAGTFLGLEIPDPDTER